MEEPANSDLQYGVQGFVTDPDYFHLVPYLVVNPDDVVDDSQNVASPGDSSRYPDATFWTVVHVAAFDGTKTYGIDFLRQLF